MGSNPILDDEASSFCLKWNDYASNLSVAFQDLRRVNDFFDVTLLTSDGSVQAHRVILRLLKLLFRFVRTLDAGPCFFSKYKEGAAVVAQR